MLMPVYYFRARCLRLLYDAAAAATADAADDEILPPLMLFFADTA